MTAATAVRVRVAACLSALVVAVSGLALVCATPSWAGGGLHRVGQLRNAPIPKSCRHRAARLQGFSKDFGTDSYGASRGYARLLKGKAVFGRFHRGGPKRAVVPLGCSAGGVSWPMLLLVYKPGPKLVGTVNLARVHPGQEHEDVIRLRFVRHHVNVRFVGYEGCCFAETTYQARLTMRHGTVRWHHSRPLTVDYAKNRYDWSFGEGIVQGPHDAKTWLRETPRSFRRYIQYRWNRMHRHSGGCTYTPVVTVDRYSHKGFASGGETACGGFATLWGRVRGHWKLVLGWQDYPNCGSLSRIQRRGLQAVGGKCFRGTHVRTLGHWPRSGE